MFYREYIRCSETLEEKVLLARKVTLKYRERKLKL